MEVRRLVSMGRAEGWRGMLYMSSLLCPVALLGSSSEIAQRWSSRLKMHISVRVSRILLCIKNSPGRQRRNLKLIRVAQNKSCLACNTDSLKKKTTLMLEVFHSGLWKDCRLDVAWNWKGCGLVVAQNVSCLACNIPTLCTEAKNLVPASKIQFRLVGVFSWFRVC